jgi:two-component system, OmpR family, response regulator
MPAALFKEEYRASNALSVLVVDDDADVREYLQDFLQGEGFRVETIGNPLLVVDRIRDEVFHLVVLDLMMPKLSGLELLSKIRDVDSDIAVIILTGFPSLETATSSIQHDIVAYIQKPFVAQDFRSAIARVARRKGIAMNREEELVLSIGQQVRELRRVKGLTLRQVARRTNLSVSLISQVERAEAACSIATLYKLAVALEVTVEYLIEGF